MNINMDRVKERIDTADGNTQTALGTVRAAYGDLKRAVSRSVK